MSTSKGNNLNQYYIVIDLGTTHIKVGIFDINGSTCKIYKQPTPITSDDFGQIYEPITLYEIIKDQLSSLIEQYRRIRGISITGMSEAGLIVNRKTGTEVSPIIPWFDQRTVDLASKVGKEQEKENFLKTGLHNSYKYGIYKYLWLLNHYSIKKEDTRVTLNPGETAKVSFTIDPEQFMIIKEDGSKEFEPGSFTIYAGGCQPDAYSELLSGTKTVSRKAELIG